MTGKKHKETTKELIGKGNLGKKLSEETKKRISESKKGENHPNYGKHHSEELKRKISKAKLGKEHSEETRKKMSESQKGSKNHFFGKEHSEESIKKIKKARLKQVLPLKDSSIEVKIQNFLKELGIEYFTHQYMKIEHGYQCDILIPSMNLVVECDGDYWHKYPIGREIDDIRTKELIERGFKVLRIWEYEINKMDINNFKNKLINFKNG